MTKRLFNRCLCCLLFLSFNAASKEYLIIFKDHLFYPSQITIPANKKVKLLIENQDSTPEEFDSFDLKQRKSTLPKTVKALFI
ncbi:cupredoxin domain-containing protein [Pseudoalteromonas sp. B193]